jgi:N-acetylglucosamine-6-phosphate deacetylase
MMTSKSITGRDPSSCNVLEVTIEDGHIQAIAPSHADEAPWLSPGFIDLQVNGYLGSDVNSDDVNPEVVIALTRKILSIGGLINGCGLPVAEIKVGEELGPGRDE